MHYTNEEVTRHLSAQRKSGLTAAAYCKAKGIAVWTFYGWLKRRPDRSRIAIVQKTPLPFVKMALPAQSINSRVMEIVTGTGITIRIPGEMDIDRAGQLLIAVKRSGMV
jgi:hypothetical protein